MRMLHPMPLAHLRAGRKTPRTAQVLLWRHQSLPRQCADNIGPLILLDNKANTLFGNALFEFSDPAKHLFEAWLEAALQDGPKGGCCFYFSTGPRGSKMPKWARVPFHFHV